MICTLPLLICSGKAITGAASFKRSQIYAHTNKGLTVQSVPTAVPGKEPATRRKWDAKCSMERKMLIFQLLLYMDQKGHSGHRIQNSSYWKGP